MKRLNLVLSLTANPDDIAINMEYQKCNCDALLIYQSSGNAIDCVKMVSQWEGVAIQFNQCETNTSLLVPTNFKVDASLKFCLHSGNDLHER